MTGWAFGIRLGRGSDAHGVVLCDVDKVARDRGLLVGDVVVGALGELFDATTDWRQVNHQILVREHRDMPLDLIVRLDATSVSPTRRIGGPSSLRCAASAARRGAASLRNRRGEGVRPEHGRRINAREQNPQRMRQWKRAGPTATASTRSKRGGCDPVAKVPPRSPWRSLHRHHTRRVLVEGGRGSRDYTM